MLTTAARLHAVQLNPLLAWFENKLTVDIDSDVPDMGAFARKIRDPSFKARALNILTSVDIPVLDVRSNDATALPGVAVNIEFLDGRHAAPAVWVDAKAFSSGAHQLVRLIALLVSSSPEDRFVAIDEFDAHLHPTITRGLLQSITESTANNPLQILVVTHNTAILDLEILRRDEIWLMSAKAEQGSKLTRLPEFSPRRSESIARGYLSGRYESLPKILSTTLLENLSNEHAITPH